MRILLYWAYEHYLEMIDFEEGRIDRMLMYWFMIVLYKTTGFWPTVILPFVAAGAIALAGVSLQIRDIARTSPWRDAGCLLRAGSLEGFTDRTSGCRWRDHCVRRPRVSAVG